MTTVVESGIGCFVAGSVAGPIRMKSVARKKAKAPPAARNGARLGPGMWIPGGAGGVGQRPRHRRAGRREAADHPQEVARDQHEDPERDQQDQAAPVGRDERADDLEELVPERHGVAAGLRLLLVAAGRARHEHVGHQRHRDAQRAQHGHAAPVVAEEAVDDGDAR